MKTHAGWDLIQIAPGTFVWRTPLDQIVRVGPDGTTHPPDEHTRDKLDDTG